MEISLSWKPVSVRVLESGHCAVDPNPFLYRSLYVLKLKFHIKHTLSRSKKLIYFLFGINKIYYYKY